MGFEESARLPKLIVNAPPNRLDLIRRIFKPDERAEKDTFHITAGEITRRQYARFLRDPFARLGLHAEAGQPKDHSYEPPDWHEQSQNLDLPVTNLDWWSAYAFAAWAGGRLPTVEEWASAASGQGQRLYPWGDAFGPGLAVTAESRLASPLPLNGSPKDGRGDVTPEGIYDLGGNVSEWTRSVAGSNAAYNVRT